MEGRSLHRYTAFETVSQAVTWLRDAPVLLIAFLAVQAMWVVGELTSDVLWLVAALLGLYVRGAAYVYAEDAVRGGTTSFGTTIGRVLNRALSLLGVAVVYGVLVGLGTVFFVLPGIYLALRLVLAFPACVLDDQNAIDSLETSWEAAEGNLLKLLGVFLLVGTCALVAEVLVALVLASSLQGVAFDLFGDHPVYLAATAPVYASVSAILELATARVYIENRPDGVGEDADTAPTPSPGADSTPDAGPI